MDQPLMIGALARATGVTTKTIRYYEQAGVLPAPGRSEAGYRQYTKRDVHRLLFIRRARALGLSLKDLKVLTAELDDGLCGTMRPRLLELVHLQLDTVQRQIVEFQVLQQQLEQVVRQLLTASPLDETEGCLCLDHDAASPREGSQQPCTSLLGADVMNTQPTLETFTIVPTTSCGGDSGCGCGCGCDVVYLPVSSVRKPPRTRGDVPKDATP